MLDATACCPRFGAPSPPRSYLPPPPLPARPARHRTCAIMSRMRSVYTSEAQSCGFPCALLYGMQYTWKWGGISEQTRAKRK